MYCRAISVQYAEQKLDYESFLYSDSRRLSLRILPPARLLFAPLPLGFQCRVRFVKIELELELDRAHYIPDIALKHRRHIQIHFFF